MNAVSSFAVGFLDGNLTQIVLDAVKNNWMLLLIAYLVKPEPVYQLWEKLQLMLKIKQPTPTKTAAASKEPDLLDLVTTMIRRNQVEGLGAEEELRALLNKIVGASTAAKK